MKPKDYIGNTYRVERLRVETFGRSRFTITDEIEVIDYDKDERGEFFSVIVAGTPIPDPHWDKHVMACDAWDLIEQIDPGAAREAREREEAASLAVEQGDRQLRYARTRGLRKSQNYRDVPRG